MGRSEREKGTRFERAVRSRLAAVGVAVDRELAQSRDGGADLRGELTAPPPGWPRRLVIECKVGRALRLRAAWRQLAAAAGGEDAVRVVVAHRLRAVGVRPVTAALLDEARAADVAALVDSRGAADGALDALAPGRGVRVREGQDELGLVLLDDLLALLGVRPC